VLALAETLYDHHAFDRMPELADASDCTTWSAGIDASQLRSSPTQPPSGPPAFDRMPELADASDCTTWSAGKPLPHKADAPAPSSGCTNCCTTETKLEEGDPLALLAAALLGLSAADRARLAAMLIGQQPKGVP
jgi:hypothetical protein